MEEADQPAEEQKEPQQPPDSEVARAAEVTHSVDSTLPAESRPLEPPESTLVSEQGSSEAVPQDSTGTAASEFVEETHPGWFVRAKPYLEAGAYLAAVIGTFFIGWQSMMTRESLSITRDTLHATGRALAVSQRAYVSVTGLDLIPLGGEDARRVQVLVIVRNTGNTPTRTLWWRGGFSRSRGSDCPASRIELNGDTFGIAQGVLAAGEENRRLLDLGDLEEDQISQIHGGDLRQSYYGALVYKDFLSNEAHITRFCYEIVTGEDYFPKHGASYTPCCEARSNCADGECGENDQAFLASPAAFK